MGGAGRIHLHSDTHEIPGRLQNSNNRACTGISHECCCSWETINFTLWHFLRRRWKQLPSLKKKKLLLAAKSLKTFHCFAYPQQLHDTSLKVELQAERNKVSRGRKRFQKTKDEQLSKALTLPTSHISIKCLNYLAVLLKRLSYRLELLMYKDSHKMCLQMVLRGQEQGAFPCPVTLNFGLQTHNCTIADIIFKRKWSALAHPYLCKNLELTIQRWR